MEKQFGIMVLILDTISLKQKWVNPKKIFYAHCFKTWCDFAPQRVGQWPDHIVIYPWNDIVGIQVLWSPINCSFHILPIRVNGNSILPITQTKMVASSSTPPFLLYRSPICGQILMTPSPIWTQPLTMSQLPLLLPWAKPPASLRRISTTIF